MEALGLAGWIIAIVWAVSASYYGTINKITDLPAAFKNVGKDAKEMERTFETLEKKFKEDPGATSWWASVHRWYRTALRSVKARYIDLMKSILRGLEKLATARDPEAIKTAIDELSAVPPSLDDSAFDAFGQAHARMKVSDNATAQQINAQGGSHTFNSGRNVFSGPIQSLSFGKDSRESARKGKWLVRIRPADYRD